MKLIGDMEIPKTNEFPKEVNRHVLNLKKGNYKYLKVKVNPFGVTPEWHPAYGKKVWLFVDEIMIY